ncbi:MAG: hypothetical protein QOJ82_3695, partial [Solirubrobacteraceae bacterium]|nr:hypothetical protein [Solirubrobacteraceae bacterium]
MTTFSDHTPSICPQPTHLAA